MRRLLFALAALAIGLAVRDFALTDNLAEDIKAFDEFNLLRMKVAEAITTTMLPLWPRSSRRTRFW